MRHLALIPSLGLLVMGLLCGQQTPAAEAREHMGRGELLVSVRRYAEAFREIQVAVEADPDNLDYQRRLAEVRKLAFEEAVSAGRLLANVDPQKAERWFQAAVLYDPSNADAARELAAVRVRLEAGSPAASSHSPESRNRFPWQVGRVLNSTSGSQYLGSLGGTSSNGNVSVDLWGRDATYNGSSRWWSTPLCATYQTYVVEIGEYVYVASERLFWIWSRPARLIINAPVRAAVGRDRLFILDEDGKQHVAWIEKQILRQPEE